MPSTMAVAAPRSAVPPRALVVVRDDRQREPDVSAAVEAVPRPDSAMERLDDRSGDEQPDSVARRCRVPRRTVADTTPEQAEDGLGIIGQSRTAIEHVEADLRFVLLDPDHDAFAESRVLHRIVEKDVECLGDVPLVAGNGWGRAARQFEFEHKPRLALTPPSDARRDQMR